MATEKFTNKPQQSFVSGGDRVASHALYIATVKATADNERMGRIRVFVNAFDGDQNDPKTWITVRYLTPFYGVTPSEFAVPGTNDWSKTQKSYGMWMPPPDIGTRCAVMFEEGDLSRGYVIGYPLDLYMNNMIPGNPSSRLKSIDEDSDDYDPELLQQKIANTPVTEYNKANDVSTPDTTRKPVHPFVDTLISQGLANDNVRGNTSSSARRESPSQVFGISTPGPIDFTGQISKDPKVGNFHGAIQDKDGKVIKRANSRQGGHTFVMDDGTPQENVNNEIVGNKANELIRLRTRTGHQMVMHDTEGLIYIGSASGKTWLEFTKDGKIDIFAEDSVSVHTKNDFNFRADRDVNIEAGRNINMKAVGTVPTEANAFHDKQLDKVSTGAIRLESVKETTIKAGSEAKIEVQDALFIETMLQDVHITSAEGKMNVKTKNDISLQSSDGKLQVSNTGTDIDGGTINFNSGTVSVTDPTSARHDPLIVHNVPNTDTQYVFPYKTDARSVTANGKTIQLASSMKRVPVHEEWTLHEDKARTFVTPDRTDREYIEPINDEKAGNDLSTRT